MERGLCLLSRSHSFFRYLLLTWDVNAGKRKEVACRSFEVRQTNTGFVLVRYATYLCEHALGFGIFVGESRSKNRRLSAPFHTKFCEYRGHIVLYGFFG